MAHILVAEDERDIRELINFTLMLGGHTVTTVANGEDAIAMAGEVKPDLILMDVRMPRLTGYEACRRMKSMDALKHIPVVFLTAKGQDEEIQAAMNAGGIAHILKPFSPDDLNRRVADILRQVEVRA
ncbi:MAG: response regulator [Chloroflexota bacterium]|nr:MAG: two-component system response regulator [Chloroflexota bacterium]